MPTKVVYGKNSFKDIGVYVNQRRVLLITSQGFVARGLVDVVKSYVGNIVQVISNINSHPDFTNLEQVYNQAHHNQFELIVAIGGGSVIDAAKFISVYNEHKEYQFVERMTKGGVEKEAYQVIPIISVPTTAGTGSEISPYATIWDTQARKKYSLNLPDLFCELAIYDPVLTLSAPKEITIQTGLDTLSHSLESIWNKNANPITVSHAIRAAKLVMGNLVKLSDNLENLEYRDNMMRACMYAGFAFSNTQTAIAHAISYYITSHKGVDHGIACSFTLPMLIDNVIGKNDFIDQALQDIFGELSSNKLRGILKELGVSTEFEDYGVSKEDFEDLKASLKNNQRAGNSLVEIR